MSVVARFEHYSTTTISDALASLNIVGYLPSVRMLSPNPNEPYATNLRVCGPAHNVIFNYASEISTPALPHHHVDVAPPSSMIVISAPSDAPNAVWGGLMTARAKHLRAKGAVVLGNARDVMEARQMNFPVFARGTSTLGSNLHLRVQSIGEPIKLQIGRGMETIVRAGDYVVADFDGVVCVPAEKVEQVLEACEERAEIDEKCMKDITAGRSIIDTFGQHRKKKA